MFKIGCAEQILEVPLFTELCGYGPYAGRRNTDDRYARELCAAIASRLRMNPDGIAIVATHTHSGPALSSESPDTSGIRNAEFQDYWKRTVLKMAEQAFSREEEIASAEAGKATLARPISANRVDPEKNITDPAVRWMRFKRPDGSVKLLIHNHGVHGIADDGPNYQNNIASFINTSFKSMESDIK